MRRESRFLWLLIWSVYLSGSFGCGTTRWTDTQRTATEQLLISDAVDRAIQQIDFRVLAGHVVYFDDQYLDGAVDEEYLTSTLRQHLLAAGCTLTDSRSEAKYVVEARAGAVGTDRHDLLYGLPATNLPGILPIPGVPTSLPEVPLAKRTNQVGVAKLAVFAYDRETGRSLWQSGVASNTSQAQDYWVLGIGPVQKGTIYDGTVFAGQKLRNPFVRRTPKVESVTDGGVELSAEAFFERSAMPVARRSDSPGLAQNREMPARETGGAAASDTSNPDGRALPPQGPQAPPVLR
jgi:hypothetical protein